MVDDSKKLSSIAFFNVSVAENGFLVEEQSMSGCVGGRWVFETAAALGDFMEKWGRVITNINTGEKQ